MAAKIKLKRIGKKRIPSYRVVIQDESTARRGRYIDWIGTYNPVLPENKFEIDKEKAKDWLSKGAMPTDRVRILLGKAGVLPPVSFEGKIKRQPKVKEGAEAAAPAAPAAEAKAPAQA